MCASLPRVAGVVSRNIQRKPSSLQTSPGLQGHDSGAAGGQVRVQFSQMFRVRLLFFSWQKQHVTRNASVFHRVFLLLQEVLLHHIPISLFVTISEGVYRAEAPLLLLCYRSSLSPCPLSIVISRQTTATGTMIPETLRNVQLLGEYLNIKQQQALVRSTCSSQGWIYEQNCRQSLGQEL